MICLFLDYLQYRSLTGRYGNGRGSLLPDLFDETIPDEVLRLLKPADLIWMHSKRSIRSWLIMYYCHLPLSHISTYLGNGKIVHATTGGVVSHPLRDLFDRGYRFLPCKVLLGDRKKRELVRVAAEEWIGTPYSYRRVIIAWLYIITGRNWGTFKSKFYLDFLVLYLFCATLTPSPFWQLILSIALAHLALISAFAMLWRFRPIPFHRRGLSFNMYFSVCLNTPMLPIIKRGGSLDDINPADIIAAFRERD